MQLQQLFAFLPQKHGYNLNVNPLAFAIHSSTHYMAFVTRGHELVFYNRRTGRTVILLASKHGIEKVMFTEKYLVCVEKGMPEVLIFSVKSEKLKKKLTGLRSQALALSYCAQNSIFCTASHDVCIIWDEPTLTSAKMLKCSTSSYSGCHFTTNGQYLFTSFADGNVFSWDLHNYSPRSFALSIEPHKLAGTNNFVAAYSGKKVSVADFSQQSLLFEVVEPFWQGYIEHVDFMDSFLFVKTNNGFYLSQIHQTHKIVLRNHNKLIDQIHDFQIAKHGSQIFIISKDLVTIKAMRVHHQGLSTTVPLTNPLINPANHCLGGFSNQQGCIAMKSEHQQHVHNYQEQNYKLQSMNDGLYQKGVRSQAFSDAKIKVFIRKNFILPDKYRAISLKNTLGLPINRKQFLQLERKGRHSCVRLLDSKYPLDNLNLSEAMKDMLSLLANYSPIFAESDLVPTIIFPFVCVFGEDKFFCFQILYRLFNNWLDFLFVNFPLANSQLLQNIQQIFQKQDQTLINHLNQYNISFTKLVWSLLSTLFSTNLTRDGFFAIVDTLFCHPQDPSFLLFMPIAYIEYNRVRILTMKSEKDLNNFLDEEHTVNISTFLKKAYELRQKYYTEIRYPFQPLNQNSKSYGEFTKFPRHAVKMYENKRLLQQQQYNKHMNNNKYHEQVAKQMQKMVTKIKRQSDKAVIQSQAVELQSQNQSRYTLNLPKVNSSQRRRRLEKLMTKLQQMLLNRNDKLTKIKQFIPVLNQMNQPNNQQQLDDLQCKLMELMFKLDPHQFHLPLATQPMTFGKKNVESFKTMKAAKRAQMANRLWEADKMELRNQEAQFENNFEEAMDK